MTYKYNTIGVIGLGFVGTAVARGFESSVNVVTYDTQKECTEASMSDIVTKAEILFICVPTPMNRDGTCNVDIVDSVLDEISKIQTSHRRICILKSTIPPGTTDRLALTYPNITVLFNPEFLTERNYINDFMSQENIVLGYSTALTNDQDLSIANYDTKIVSQIYARRFPDAEIYITGAKEAEMIKYIANTFLAMKVAYLNEIWQICNVAKIDYTKMTEILRNDTRLGHTHWHVPGPDGKFGFGGTCFPKDINALIKFSNISGQATPLLTAIWDKNLEMRPEKDWESDKGRAVI